MRKVTRKMVTNLDIFMFIWIAMKRYGRGWSWAALVDTYQMKLSEAHRFHLNQVADFRKVIQLERYSIDR